MPYDILGQSADVSFVEGADISRGDSSRIARLPTDRRSSILDRHTGKYLLFGPDQVCRQWLFETLEGDLSLADFRKARFQIASVSRLRWTRDFCLFDVLSLE